MKFKKEVTFLVKFCLYEIKKSRAKIACNFIKKETTTAVFSCGFEKLLRTPIFKNMVELLIYDVLPEN